MNHKFSNFRLTIKYLFILNLLILSSCKEHKAEDNTIYSIPKHDSINALYNDKIWVNYTYNNIKDDKTINPLICWYKNTIKIMCGEDPFYILKKEDQYSNIRVEVTPKPSSLTFNKTKTNQIYIKQIIEPQEIRTSFDTYISVYSKKMRDLLKKDINLYSKTTVLYDVQVHLQNAVIYADERGNKDMLRSMLNLIKIAFEEQYLTDDKWLDNGGNRAGKEVDLFIAQFLNLAIRVLSASERHGIMTNFSQKNIQIIHTHINKWIQKEVQRKRINDLNLYTVMGILQFDDYLKKKKYTNIHFFEWKKYVQNYIKYSITPKWEKETCSYKQTNYSCFALDRTGLVDHQDFSYAGYGRELTKTFSNIDPNAMFDEKGIVKHSEKLVEKVSMDLSHARRFNWFFEVLKRFGKPFNVGISEDILQGWANNLAFRVSKGTLNDPYFTTFSDGTDGWYRVNYRKRRKFGYAPGEMDIHFIGSSYGFFGVYNPKIYDWMEAWVTINTSSNFENGYAGGYKLDYLLSLLIDLRNPLIDIQ